MKARANDVRLWFKNVARSNGWVWVAILLSGLVCALLAWLHFQHQQALQLAMARTENLRLARLELNKGFLDFSLADAPGSPFDREQGLALIQQSIAEFETNLEALDLSISIAGDPSAVDGKTAAIAFRRRVNDFELALKLWKAAGGDQPGAIADVRLAFFDLERQADQIDRLNRQSLVDLTAHLNRIFVMALLAAAALLLGVCGIVLAAGRARASSDAALRESEARFLALFANNHAPMIVVIPEDGAIIDANPAACVFYGWSWQEMTTKKISEINVLSESEIKAEMQKALNKDRQFFEFRHRLSSGEVRSVEVFSGPIKYSGKKVLFSIIHDVTERKQAEIALEVSEERYRQLLQVAPVGIGVHQDNSFQYLNPAGARLLGASAPEQIIGRSIAKFLTSEQALAGQECDQRARAGEAGVYPLETTFFRLDGATIMVEALSAPITYQGRPAAQIIFSDITDRKQAQEKILAARAELQRLLREADDSRQALLSLVEDQKIAEEQLGQLNADLERRVQERTAQLEATNKELEAFAYSVSHDLRSPLRGIDGWSYALLEDYGDQLTEEARSYLGRVRSEAKRMGQLIDDLLRLSRVTRTEMQLADVDLSQIAETIARRLQEESLERQIEITIEPGLRAWADERLMEIVLTNLLANAFKFTSGVSPAQIEFGWEEDHTASGFYVRDNGVGFDMAYAGKLFGAFQRLHHQSEFPGTGIGLATVQRIIHRHGGRVWAEAKKGCGATFWFTLRE